ncbi:MAG TPA: hypothetical protein VJ741_04925 [Solirubrobacteraceae bacterium]|nr:hypothetical protein [Solirubrobacteraceae bacterium]
MSRRSRIVGFGSAGLLVLAGAVCAVVFAGGLGAILALVLIGLGCVEAVSLVFAEVGFSEDRERAHAARERERADSARHPRRPERSRLERTRGRPRRLR